MMQTSARLHYPYLVIGAGPAGGRAAKTLAGLAAPGAVALLGEESWPPYERPPLSKGQLFSPEDPGLPTLYDRAGLEADGVHCLFGDRAVGVDPHAQQVVTAAGGQIGYDRLLLCTGASARTLPFGAPGDVLTLRTYEDSLAIRARLVGAGSVIVVGGGFIGLEVAASARGLGLNVHVVEAANRLMQRAVPPVVSLCFARKFVKEGVAFTMKTPVEDIRRVGTGHRILLRDGTKLDADLIVAGIGAQPNTALAEMAGLEVDGGILVDGDGRTSNRYIFAAGDVAVFPHETFGLRRRLEAWEPALDQAERVAHVMAGVDAPAIPSPWVWSNQFDWNLQMAGFGDLADREIVRGAPEGDSFTVFHIRGAQLVGAVSVNAGRDMTLVRRHLGEDLSEAQLVALPDTTNQLRKVLRGQIELQGAATG